MQIRYKNLLDFLSANNIDCVSKLDNNFLFTELSSLLSAKKNHLTFFSNQKFKDNLKETKASACLIKHEDAYLLPLTCFSIIVDDPYKSFAYLTNLFSPQVISNNSISKNAFFDSSFKFSNNLQVGNFVSIKENSIIGDSCIIFDNCTIGPNVSIGKDTIIYSNSSISNSIIGSSSIIQSGCSIGDSGFGFFTPDKTTIQHIGNVIIGNNCNIGSNCTIDRATIDNTILGNNIRIDNLVHIAHNVVIGNGTIIAGQTGIAGGTKIGENCVIGGQVGINGHIKIVNNVRITKKSGVTKSVADNSIVAGFPAIDIKEWRKNIINLNKINND